ncbi:MAG: NTP transferase domain-containing protein [Pleurocapsa minor GSE-CHR-MK-17-07R]|jgi:bifunctional UDP-N-acetylglucosamine pyrophosphorylase/glucosamine-1-phosphate N-acetyltransferase|nr:NTP transferase domain-containing protein [Pleurocapsa minor GSE-CHR-MK 17-07R]
MTAHIPTLIILAGGASSRMWPIREKSLLPFGLPDGSAPPLLIGKLAEYQTLGFRRVVIVGNPENEAEITEATASFAGMDVRVVVQPVPRGMGDALLCAAPALGEAGGQAVYITQVHDVVDADLHRLLISRHQANPAASLLTGYEMEEYFPGGYLIVDADNRISGIIEKPGAGNQPSNLVNIVAHVHADAGRLLDAIRAEYASDAPGDDHYERAMDALMKAGAPYVAVPYRGGWSALKYPWHVLDVMNAYLAQIKGQHVAESAFVAKTASLVGDVVIADGAKIFPGAAVVGPAYVGRGVIVGNNALVRGSMVMDRCEVGYTTEVARSYVGEHVSMHACRVLDSVFMPGVNFSAGCTTANLRIDRGLVKSDVKGSRLVTGRDKLGAVIGQDAFISVDAMTMPGVKIGANAQVGPGTHVVQDIRDGQRVYVKQELVIIDPS